MKWAIFPPVILDQDLDRTRVFNKLVVKTPTLTSTVILMDVKTAVKTAIEYVADVFKSEHPEYIGLEEVVLDEHEDVWEVTIGFSRPWDSPVGGIANALQPRIPRRQYKVVRIDNRSGQVKSIKIRELKNA